MGIETIGSPSFQFQIGTIKSLEDNTNEQPEEVFQFQIGTIKSNLFVAGGKLVTSFNSKLVRLKVLQARTAQT